MLNGLLDKQVSQPIARYPELLVVIRARIEEIGATYASIDNIAGFSDRYVSKVLRAEKGLSVRSLLALLGAIALLPTFHPDDARLADLRKRSDWRARKRNGSR